MATSPSYGDRPPLQGYRRSLTLSHRPLSFHEKAGLDKSNAAADLLYSHPSARIFSFSPPTDSIPADSKVTVPDTDYPVDTVETLPWRSRTETLLATGPMIIEKVRGSTEFLKSGDQKVMHAILRNSQCWCVDGESKFVMRVGKLRYYRIELPSTSAEEKEKVQELKNVLSKILRFERTPCPFKRAFHVDLPDDAITPRRRGTWKRRESSLLPSTPDTDTPPLRRTKNTRTWSFQGQAASSPAKAYDHRESDYRFTPSPATSPLARRNGEDSRPQSPLSLASSEVSDAKHESSSDGGMNEEDIHKANVHEANVHEEDVDEAGVDEEDVHEEGVDEADVHEAGVHEEDVNEADVHETDIHEEDVHKGVHEKDVNEADVHETDIHEEDVHEGIHEKDVNEADVHETDIHEEDVHEGVHEKDVNEADVHETDVHEADGRPEGNSLDLTADIEAPVSSVAELNEPETLPTGAPKGGEAGEGEERDGGKDHGQNQEHIEQVLAHHNTIESAMEKVPLETTQVDRNEQADGGLNESAGPDISWDSRSVSNEEVPSEPEADAEASTPSSELENPPDESSNTSPKPQSASDDDQQGEDGLGASDGGQTPDDSSSIDSFHTPDSLEQEPFDQSLLADDPTLTTKGPHQRELSEIMVTPSTVTKHFDVSNEGPTLTGGPNLDKGSIPELARSSAGFSWSEGVMASSSAIQNGLRRRLKSQRSLSPLPASNVLSPPQQNPGIYLASTILQKACDIAIVKPVEVFVLLVHIAARIAGGATVNDLISGELFRWPEQQRRRNTSFPDQIGLRREDGDDEDDFGVPIRGRSRSSDKARVSPTRDDDVDSLFDLD